MDESPLALAERVRAACLAAALHAYEDAAANGICAEGAWEIAVGALQRLDLTALLQLPAPRSSDQTSSR